MCMACLIVSIIEKVTKCFFFKNKYIDTFALKSNQSDYIVYFLMLDFEIAPGCPEFLSV